mmetsp:Transcript_56422/g.98611  ORF Transcript_56422/g.98611 Transcript_56422/m.98611 type:complete len:237 (+) Transcript_56422:74-784(+)
MVRPMNQFCCGCPLVFGAWIILILQLILNSFYILTATFNVILKIPTIGFQSSLSSQTFNAAWCLLGMPFIFSAMWGLLTRQEANVRMYLVYQLISLVLDLFYTFSFFLMTDVCGMVPSALARHGSAFACGFMRLTSLAFIFLMTAMAIYFTFVIWSLCEDFKVGGSGTGFPQLLGGVSEYRSKQRYGGIASGGTFGGSGSLENFPMAATFSAPGLGGQRIFDGSYHETSYPPPPKF